MVIDVKSLEGLSERLLEDRLYEIVVQELEAGEQDPSSQARAFEEARGNKELAKALYFKHRVRRLRDQILEKNIVDAMQASDERQQKEREREWLRKVNEQFKKRNFGKS